MAGLDPAIHCDRFCGPQATLLAHGKMDGRLKGGHDELLESRGGGAA